MSGQHVGYIRVSSVDQNTERQLADTKLDRQFEDKLSGKNRQRPELEACLKHLRKEDTLHVHSIDRLARNLVDLLALVNELVERGVTIKFHKENLTFNGEANPMQELQLSMLGAVAQFERALIRERQREGIEIAKAAGRYKGRKAAMSVADIEKARSFKMDGKSMVSIAKEFGVARSTLYNALTGKAP
jgi:DNA invertase Pin-like site-specific DNA recombinase